MQSPGRGAGRSCALNSGEILIGLSRWCCFFFFFFFFKFSAVFVPGACVLSQFNPVWLFATLWIVAGQTPLSMGFSRQEYWTGLPGSSPKQTWAQCIGQGSIPDPPVGGENSTTEPPMPLLKILNKVVASQGGQLRKKKIRVLVGISYYQQGAAW